MELEAVSASEISKQRVKFFTKDMKARRFEGPSRGKLDTFLLLTFDQKTEEDKINFVSWAVDSSRIYPDYIKTVLSYLELPEKYNHALYPNQRIDMQYYENIIPKGEGKAPLIALGIGPGGRTVLYRLKGFSTKDSFERLKKAVGL